MATGKINPTAITEGTFDTSSSQEIAFPASMQKNTVGVRLFVVVASSGADLCIGESSGGTGGWRKKADDNSYEVGLFDPTKGAIPIVGAGGLPATGSYTLAPAAG